MGVIRRQGSKQFGVHLVGVLIGALSTLFIYPHNTEIYGFARFLIDGALFLSPFVLLGVGHLPVKYYPRFKDINPDHGGYLTLLLAMAGVSCLIFLIAMALLWPTLRDFFADKHPYFQDYAIFIIPIAILSALAAIFSRYTSNFKRITIPYVFTNLLQKIVLPIIVLLSAYQYISVREFVWALVLMSALVVMGLTLYLQILGELRFGSVDGSALRENLQEMLVFAGYGLLGGVGSALATRIDSVMVATLVDPKNNGAYNIGAFMTNVIGAPLMAVATISGPIISSAWKDGNELEIRKIFSNASSVLLLAGVGMFLLLITSIEDLQMLFPKKSEFASLYWVVFFLGVAKLFDLAASVNNEIILYSKFFRFNLVAILLLGFLNIVGNYLFIVPLGYGMLGAAIGTAVSLLVYNLAKLLFIYWKMRMTPFTGKTILLLVIGVVLFAITSQLHFPFEPLMNIVVRSILLGLVYVSIVFYLNISKDFNDLIHLTWRKIINRF